MNYEQTIYIQQPFLSHLVPLGLLTWRGYDPCQHNTGQPRAIYFYMKTSTADPR